MSSPILHRCCVRQIHCSCFRNVEQFSSCEIFLGIDTRPSGPQFRDKLLSLFKFLGVKTVDMGLITTPQLHHAVYSRNDLFHSRPTISPVQLLAYYYSHFASAFSQFLELLPCVVINKCSIDVANGVGGVAMLDLSQRINIDCVIVNNGDGILNSDCGADFVITNKKVLHSLQRLALLIFERIAYEIGYLIGGGGTLERWIFRCRVSSTRRGDLYEN